MEILSRLSGDSKLLAILIDPDKCNQEQLAKLSNDANQGWIHLFLIGGSLLFKNQVKEIFSFQYLIHIQKSIILAYLKQKKVLMQLILSN